MFSLLMPFYIALERIYRAIHGGKSRFLFQSFCDCGAKPRRFLKPTRLAHCPQQKVFPLQSGLLQVGLPLLCKFHLHQAIDEGQPFE